MKDFNAILFTCDHNAIRSPMAEGITKKRYGFHYYVQSAGIKSNLDVDGFAIAVCAEIGVELGRHESKNLEEIHKIGDALHGFDLIISLSTNSYNTILKLIDPSLVRLEYWPIKDPSHVGEGREARLAAYRETRDSILERIEECLGPPKKA